MFQNNKISKLMGLRYPIFQGGMAWASSSKLACAVSNAGGLGILGCAGREAEWVLNEIKYIKNNTLKPIGLNVALNDKSAVDIVELAIGHGIKYFTMGGDK
ncbi:nitronate monooxygenase [Planktomarina sp.]|nr:nitronate monooxygenase [Planktomarina sp.]